MTKILAWCRERPWTLAAGVGLLAGAVGFGAGRFAAPSKVTETTSAAWSSTWDWSQLATTHQVAGAVHRTTTRRTAPGRPAEPAVPGPDGKPVCPACPEVDEEVVEEDIGPVTTDTSVGTAGKGAEAGTSSSSKVTENDYPRLTLGLKGGLAIDELQPTWGAFGHYRVWGPLNLGVDYTRKDNVLLGTVSVTF